LDEAAQLGHEARKMESILSMMSAVAVGRLRRPDLRWHYRSLHPALIQPSNELFYDNRLVVFPSASPVAENGRTGIVFHHLPLTEYEGGERKRVNRLEAQAVVEAVMAHLRGGGGESLMVAAMNKPQADLIYEQLQIRERHEPELFARFRARHPHEPLDVKNLENVQGDERDVVFISVTYGRDGAGVIRQQFGPLLRDGGERRLNVLITRARRRCEVFSNLTADDLRGDPSQRGLAAFQKYLRFAQSGMLPGPSPTGLEPESSCKAEVLARLAGSGYEVEPQVGSEGYRIDLAVRDPEAPGRYLLGIECDGASYHSARSARDRDKLRQRVLEARGWRLHRIWSSDWWRDREGEMDRLRQAIEQARAETRAGFGEQESPPPATPEPPPVQLTEEHREAGAAPARSYPATPPFTAGTDLVVYARQVIEVEGPIHHELLLQRLREAAGFGRLGSQVRADLEALLRDEAGAGRIRRWGDAWVPAGHPGRVEPRDRSALPAVERRIDYVPDVELAAALRHVVQNAFGIGVPECRSRALQLLGFRSAQERGQQRLDEVLRTLVDSGDVVVSEGTLRLR
jgi:very-short-patch-repair endonuclease